MPTSAECVLFVDDDEDVREAAQQTLELADIYVEVFGTAAAALERIKNGWTPEQISNHMIHERAPLRVCQETIYRYIYSKEGQREDLWWYLPTHRVARRPMIVWFIH
mgnify:CR=1 FL=1